MGGKHVPTMHCGSRPFAWKEPLTLAYLLGGRLPVPVALHLWVQREICFLDRPSTICKHPQAHMYSPDTANGTEK